MDFGGFKGFVEGIFGDPSLTKNPRENIEKAIKSLEKNKFVGFFPYLFSVLTPVKSNEILKTPGSLAGTRPAPSQHPGCMYGPLQEAQLASLPEAIMPRDKFTS